MACTKELLMKNTYFIYALLTQICRHLFTHFFRQLLWTEKQNPPTFSLLECMLWIWCLGSAGFSPDFLAQVSFSPSFYNPTWPRLLNKEKKSSSSLADGSKLGQMFILPWMRPRGICDIFSFAGITQCGIEYSKLLFGIFAVPSDFWVFEYFSFGGITRCKLSIFGILAFNF